MNSLCFDSGKSHVCNDVHETGYLFCRRHVSIYQSTPEEHWIAVKHILKYLRRTRDYMLVYQDESLEAIGYTDSDFQSDIDSRKSTSRYVFTFGG